MRRHIPNALTCCNLISGCVAIVFASNGSTMAIWFIVLGAVFDFFDGMVARLLGVQSPIGKELDSLADVVTFGVAPSMMLYSYLLQQCPVFKCAGLSVYMPYIAFLIAAFSALRLAKFNLDDRQTTSFIGLPTPANALFWASLIVGISPQNIDPIVIVPVLIILVLLSSWLLVSEISMFALKFKSWGWKGNEIKYIFLLTCIPCLLLLKTIGIAIVIAWYILLSILVGKRKST